jgi:amino acid transporter
LRVNDFNDLLQRRKNQVISAVFGINLVFGVLIVMMFPGLIEPTTSQAAIAELRNSPLNLGYQFAALVVCFLWLGLDSKQLDIRRPWWLNVGIVLFTSLFVPYYLYKTRPSGHRLRAILSFFGIVIGGAFVMTIGAFMALAMSPGTVAPSAPL